ncbi:MAG: Uma2 family endonuclease [Chloroflexi bacterium]|nr:MAG: Uma2 family endonuclease [Chloroflexota bacterium]
MAEMVTEKSEVPPRSAASSERTWPPPQGQWTYEDWLRLPDDGWQYEVIRGVLYMVPAPTPKHQRVSRDLGFAMWQFVRERGLGEVFAAPTDVYLPGQETPVQPDLLFVATGESATIGERGIEGVLDLVVEILSPRTWWRDRRVKMPLYEETGVRELWLVDPDLRTIEVYVLREGAYALLGQWGPGEQVRSEVLAGFVLGVDDVMPVEV